MKNKAIEYRITAKKQDFEVAKVCSSKDAYDFAKKFYHDDILIYESSFIIMLSRSNAVIGYAKISQGGVCGTVVDLKLIAKYAIDSLSSGIILVHNHPSGNMSPSVEDKRIASKIKEGLSLFDIHLMDSIIISDVSYYSMLDEGLL